MLAGRGAAAEGRGETGAALAAARELLAVPDGLVHTLHSYGDSEAMLLAHRAAIGLAIESLPPPRP